MTSQTASGGASTSTEYSAVLTEPPAPARPALPPHDPAGRIRTSAPAAGRRSPGERRIDFAPNRPRRRRRTSRSPWSMRAHHVLGPPLRDAVDRERRRRVGVGARERQRLGRQRGVDRARPRRATGPGATTGPRAPVMASAPRPRVRSPPATSSGSAAMRVRARRRRRKVAVRARPRRPTGHVPPGRRRRRAARSAPGPRPTNTRPGGVHASGTWLRVDRVAREEARVLPAERRGRSGDRRRARDRLAPRPLVERVVGPHRPGERHREVPVPHEPCHRRVLPPVPRLHRPPRRRQPHAAAARARRRAACSGDRRASSPRPRRTAPRSRTPWTAVDRKLTRTSSTLGSVGGRTQHQRRPRDVAHERGDDAAGHGQRGRPRPRRPRRRRRRWRGSG